MVEEKVKKERKMTIRGTILPTEKKKKEQDDASKRLKKIEEKKKGEGKQKDIKKKEECFWSSKELPPAELSWDELQYEVIKED